MYATLLVPALSRMALESTAFQPLRCFTLSVLTLRHYDVNVAVSKVVIFKAYKERRNAESSIAYILFVEWFHKLTR